MSYEGPGQNSGQSSIQKATGQKSMAERLLSLLSPRAVFITIGGGILVSAALVLTLVAGSNGSGPVVKALQSYAGFNTGSTSWWQPIDTRCPAGYRVDAIGRCVPVPKPPQPVTQTGLTISVAPGTVQQGGSYTLSATYIDANGTAQKYAGFLDYQSRVCDLNNQNCQTGSGAWGEYNLVDGSVVVQLPTTIPVGIYNASFRPRNQTAWPWSNEIAVTVNPLVAPPTASACDAVGISGVTASSATSLASNPASYAVDGRLDTFWNSGRYAPASITLDLGAPYTLSKVCLKVAMSPDGQVVHAVKVGSTPETATQVATISKATQNGEWLEVPVGGTGRYVVIETTQTPSWVAWTEIKAYGSPSGDNGGGGGGGTGCLTGTVRLTSNNIVVGGSTTVSSTLVGVAVTYDTSDHAIATVSNATVFAGSTAGSTSVTGHFFYAGRSCDLTPATLTVTGGNAQGTVTTTGNSLYLCTSNGTSNSVTVTATVSRGSGKVDVAGAVNFQGPSRLEAPNAWTQTVSPGNFSSLNSTTNGQASVTIALKDYFTGTLIGSQTITATINPPSNCPQPGQSSLVVGTVYAPCQTNGNGYADSISATSGTGSSSRVIGNGRNVLTLDPNGSVSQTNVSIGNVAAGQSVSFTLVEDGSNRTLSGPVTKTVQAGQNCGPQANPAGSVSLDRGTTAGTGNTVYVVCGGGTAYFTARANNTGNVALTFSNGAGQTKTIAAGGSDSIPDALGVGQSRTFTLQYNGQNVTGGSLTVNAIRDPSCNSPSGSITFSVPDSVTVCPGTSQSVTVTASATVAATLTLSNGQSATLTGAGTTWTGVVAFTISAPNDGNYNSVSATLSASGVALPLAQRTFQLVGSAASCAPLQASITFSSGSNIYMCPGATRVVTVNGFSNRPQSTLSAGGQTVTLGYLGGTNYQGSVSITVSAPPEGNYNPYPAEVRVPGSSVAAAYSTLQVNGRNSECGGVTPAGTLSFTATGLVGGNSLYMCPGASRGASVSATSNTAGTLEVNGQSVSLTGSGTSYSGQITFNVSAPNEGNYNSYAAVLRASGVAIPLAQNTLQVNGRNSDCAAAAPTGSLSVTPLTLPLCPGESGAFSVAVTGANYGGQVSKGGTYFAGFQPPGGSWSDTVSSSMIGQTITYAGLVGGPGVPLSLTPVNVQVTQKSNCTAPVTGSFNVSPTTLALCAGESGTFTITVSGANYPGLVGKGGAIYASFSPPGGTWSDTISSNMIGQSIGYSAAVSTPLSVSLGSQTVTVTQKSNCAPTGSFNVSPNSLALCPGESGTFTATVSGASAGGTFSKGGQIVSSFSAPGGSWSDTVSSSLIGQNITYGASFANPPGLVGTETVSVTQRSGCASPAAGHITATSPITLYRIPVFPYSCSAMQGAITATNTGSVDLTFSAGGVSYIVPPGQTRNTSNWYASSGTYRYDLSGPNGTVDSVTVTVTCQ